jgi:hypothetical protein
MVVIMMTTDMILGMFDLGIGRIIRVFPAYLGFAARRVYWADQSGRKHVTNIYLA